MQWYIYLPWPEQAERFADPDEHIGHRLGTLYWRKRFRYLQSNNRCKSGEERILLSKVLCLMISTPHKLSTGRKNRNRSQMPTFWRMKLRPQASTSPCMASFVWLTCLASPIFSSISGIIAFTTSAEGTHPPATAEYSTNLPFRTWKNTNLKMQSRVVIEISKRHAWFGKKKIWNFFFIKKNIYKKIWKSR